MTEELQESSAPAPEASTNIAPSEFNFRDALPEEYKNMYPEFKKPEDFVKGYDSLVRKLGGSISIPKEDASPEELNKFYSKLGRPEKPDNYEFEINDNTKVDNDFLKKFKEVAFEAGINQKQARNLFDWYNKEIEASEGGYQKQQEEQIAKATAELKTRWGKDYEKKLQEVQGFAKKLAGEPYYEKIVKYGNDPDFITVMSELHERYAKEDRISTKGSLESGVKDYVSEARALMQDPDYKSNVEKQKIVRNLFLRVAEQRNNQ